MKSKKIIQEIEKLPLRKRISIAERILKSLRENKDKEQMKIAADLLQKDYENDEELLAFTSLDLEDFYETR